MIKRNDEKGLPLLNDGLALIDGGTEKETELGRQKLRQAIDLGIDEAIPILGNIYFRQRSFELSEEIYLIGWERKLRVAMYRLALLHGDKLVKEHDEQFYLRTIASLAKEGHLPSKARMVRDNLKGKNGLTGFLFGLVNFVPTSCRVFVEAFRNEGSWKLQR